MPIVRAVGVAVGRHGDVKSDLAERVEAAMVQAVKDAHAQGMTDQEAIRALMLEARAKVLEG
jgi:hypothetical protein